MEYHLSHLPAVQAAIADAEACDTMDDIAQALIAFKEHDLCASEPMPARAADARCCCVAPWRGSDSARRSG